jgi:hypothetical protein
MVDQVQHFDVCSVVNNMQTGEMKLQVRTHTNSVSDISMNCKEVEGLCFPILFPHGEDGHTNPSKSRMSPDVYVIARLLQPEMVGYNYMTAAAQYARECMGGRTGEPFEPTAAQSEIDEHQMQGALIFPLLRVNHFMLMARLSQYWLMNFSSRVLDQIKSIIGKIRNRIMMGQTRRTSDALTEHEEQDRRAAGYIDEPKNESYLPSSAHGSPSHMAALTKNALILVSEFGCPHIFLTLTCNPKWPEIMSQVLNGQTASDCPEVTGAVLKSRLDQMKMNIRHGKYFDGREIFHTFHVIEYQYRGLPHAHLVVCLDDAHDIDDPN